MRFEQLVDYFLPKYMRTNNAHNQYHEFRNVISAVLIALPLVLLFPVFISFLGKPVMGYFINGGLLVTILICTRLFGNYRIPMSVTAIVTYFLIYDWIKDSGLIYSSNISILHMYLLGAIWADKRYGWYAIFTNLMLFVYIYYQTLHAGLPDSVHHHLGGPLYALMMNAVITIFFGGFLAYLQFDQENNHSKIRKLQNQKISLLDEAVKKRTHQLNTIRESIATDFHDETGNMLSTITRQATLLKLKLQQKDLEPVVESILINSKNLYASSKDFLWHLNHDSDNPQELFEYLRSHGQVYYNQFDIAFSSSAEECHLLQFDPMAALNVIFIFKEAMTNVIKHASASEVHLSMICGENEVIYKLQDNGNWKEADDTIEHYGLAYMEQRCRKNNFRFHLGHLAKGTSIEIAVPVNNMQHSV